MTLAAATLSAAPLMFAAPSAHAAENTAPSTTAGTVNCLSWQDQAAYPGVCTGLKPTLSCVWANDDGTYSAALGFTNAMKDLPSKSTKGGMLYIFGL